jgi:hypothetical protein
MIYSRPSGIPLRALRDELEKIAAEEKSRFGKIVKHILIPGLATGAGIGLGRLVGPYLAEKLLWPPTPAKVKLLTIGTPIAMGATALLGTILAQRHHQAFQKAQEESHGE